MTSIVILIIVIVIQIIIVYMQRRTNASNIEANEFLISEVKELTDTLEKSQATLETRTHQLADYASRVQNISAMEFYINNLETQLREIKKKEKNNDE